VSSKYKPLQSEHWGGREAPKAGRSEASLKLISPQVAGEPRKHKVAGDDLDVRSCSQKTGIAASSPSRRKRQSELAQKPTLQDVNSGMPASPESKDLVTPTAKVVGGVFAVLLLVWVVSFGAIVWAYALTHGVYDPSPSITYQLILAAKVSLLTAVLSAMTWIGPVTHGRRISLARAVLQVGHASIVE
jgi:hypothetical protein